MGTDLLIHEASYQHGEEVLASERAHSTIGQAINIGREYVSPSLGLYKKAKTLDYSMRARNILLTHLGSAAINIPGILLAQEYENTDEWGGPIVAIANDMIEIDLDKFWKANIYATAIAHCHRTACVMEQKSVAELLWELTPEESLVCATDTEYLLNHWPWNRRSGPLIDHARRRQPEAVGDSLRLAVNALREL
jgi:ribonuclease Z